MRPRENKVAPRPLPIAAPMRSPASSKEPEANSRPHPAGRLRTGAGGRCQSLDTGRRLCGPVEQRGVSLSFKTKRDLFVTLIDEMIRAFDAVQSQSRAQVCRRSGPLAVEPGGSDADDEMQKMGAALLAAAAEDQHFSTHCASGTACSTNACVDPAWHRDRGTHHAGIGWRPVRRSSGFANTRTRRAAAFLSGALRISPRAISNLSRQRTHMSRVRSGVMTACAPRSLAVACTLSISTLLSGCGNSQSTVSEPPRAVKLAAAQSDLPHSSHRIDWLGASNQAHIRI